MIKVDYIVLNWGDATETLKCLESINDQVGDFEKHIIVVDNETTASSQQQLKSSSVPFQLVLNIENLGFSGGINSAIPHLEGSFVALINNDCSLAKDWTTQGLKQLASRDHGAVGGLEYRWDDQNPVGKTTNETMPLARINPRDASAQNNIVPPTKATSVIFMTASNLLLPASAFQQLRGFDQRFFAYYEDVDLCARIIDQGLSIIFEPKMQAWHQVNHSSKRIPFKAAYLARRNRYIVIAKHFGGDWVARYLKLATKELLANTKLLAQRQNPTISRAGALASLWAFTHLPILARARRSYRSSLRHKPMFYNKLSASQKGAA